MGYQLLVRGGESGGCWEDDPMSEILGQDAKVYIGLRDGRFCGDFVAFRSSKVP